MIKLSCIFIFLALLAVKQVSSQLPLSDIFSAKSCPQYSGMPNIDLNKVFKTTHVFLG